MSDAEAIVRDLAGDGPIYEHEFGECVLCGVVAEGPKPVTDHEPDCLWRRAVEWVEGNP